MDYHHPSGEVHIIDNNEWVSCPGLLVRSSRGVQCFKVDVLAPRPYVCRLQPVRPRRQVFTMILCSALASESGLVLVAESELGNIAAAARLRFIQVML